MERIKEVIELIEHTGDKAVVLHPDHGIYIVMKIEDYRQLVAFKPKTGQNPQVNSFAKPETDIRIYEIPQRKEELDQYWPEPLD